MLWAWSWFIKSNGKRYGAFSFPKESDIQNQADLHKISQSVKYQPLPSPQKKKLRANRRAFHKSIFLQLL